MLKVMLPALARVADGQRDMAVASFERRQREWLAEQPMSEHLVEMKPIAKQRQPRSRLTARHGLCPVPFFVSAYHSHVPVPAGGSR